MYDFCTDGLLFGINRLGRRNISPEHSKSVVGNVVRIAYLNIKSSLFNQANPFSHAIKNYCIVMSFFSIKENASANSLV